MEAIRQLQDRLLGYISDEKLELLFKALKKFIPFETDIYNDVILFESRYHANKYDWLISKTVSDANATLVSNSIKKGLITFIKNLVARDLMINELQANALLDKLDVDGPIKGDEHNNGTILHRIPREMQVKEPVKCFVRIAFEESGLYQGIPSDQDVKTEHKTIGEIIDVCLLEPTSEKYFQINSITDSEQVVIRNDYTEWIFYVKPLVAGVFPLILKIAVIEKIEGKERLRNIIIDKQINIVTHKPSPTEATQLFTKTHHELSVAGAAAITSPFSPESGTPESSALTPDPSPGLTASASGAGTSGAGMFGFGFAKTIATVLGLSLLGVWGYQLWKEYSDYNILTHTPCAEDDELLDFLGKYPDTWYHLYDGFTDDVESKLGNSAWTLTRKLKSCEGYRAYLSNCPDGAHAAVAKNELLILGCDNKEPGSSDEFKLVLNLDKGNNILTADINGGLAPYQWTIYDNAVEKSTGRFARSGKHLVELQACCRKPGSYAFVLTDDAGEEISHSFSIDIPATSDDENVERIEAGRLTIILDPKNEKLTLTIKGGVPPYKMKFWKLKNGVPKRKVFETGGPHNINIKSFRQDPGKYRLVITDENGDQAGNSFPIGWVCITDSNDKLRFSDDCWEALQKESAAKNIPFFSFYYKPASRLGKQTDCTLSDKDVMAFAEKHFFYNKKNTTYSDPCKDVTVKGIDQTPVLQFYLPNGKLAESINEYMTPAELLGIMKRVRGLLLHDRVEVDGKFTVDKIRTPRIDTPDGYYLLETENRSGDYRWVNRKKLKGPVLQVAAFQDEKDAYRTAHCLQMNGVDQEIYVHTKGTDFKYKILIAGFSGKWKAEQFKKSFRELNLCPQYLKGDGVFFFKRD